MRLQSASMLSVCCVCLATFCELVAAAPSVDSVAGNVAHGETVTIIGSGFGAKNPAKPYLWAPFEESAQPSRLGLVTEWTQVTNMARAEGEGVAGSGALSATNSSGVWTASVVASGFAWNDYNQKMYLHRKVKKNFDITSDLNWKILRVWGAGLTLPDWYIQTGNGNLSVEGVGSGGYPYDAGLVAPIRGGDLQAARGRPNVWRTDEILVKANSRPDAEDAEFYHFVDGVLVGVMPYTNYAYRSLTFRRADSGDMTLIYPVHGVKANVTFPSHYRYWVDDVYLDTTWARVVVANAPVLADATHVEVQIPTSWSGERIDVVANMRSFPPGENPFLFVVDADGSVSQGVSLGSVALPEPPRNVEVQ